MLLFLTLGTASNGQITVTRFYTPTQLASFLTGSGVSVFGATMTCPSDASGEFRVVASTLGIDSGVVLSNGAVLTILDTVGVDGSATLFASTDNGAPGDPQLSALIGGMTTEDACILEFNFRPSGDTVKFKYVFGSEEYTDYTCSTFNDVFGFLITGGSYGTATNLALVPGTTIPVCINSVNCGATGSYTIGACNALGAGSPFCAYYVNNIGGTTVTYDGLTTVLTAIAAVNPCDTYHLKLGVADASDHVFDSGVFIAGGSLSSRTTTSVTATGTSGLPYCIRGCAPGNFVFKTATIQDTAYVIRYIIGGTAVNGYDYSTIADSVIIPPLADSVILNINTLGVPPVGPKVITLQIEVPDPCHPGLYTIGAVANLTILDSFHFQIFTPDTAICLGESVHIRAIGDTDSVFTGVLSYLWAPAGTLNFDTVINPIATPTITTVYSLTVTALSALGCAPETKTIQISIIPNPVVTVDSSVVKTCVGVPVQLHAYATSTGVSSFAYSWSPPTFLSSSTIYNPIVTPTLAGDLTYTVTVSPTALAACASTDTIHVHVVPNDFVLANPDTIICRGQSVQTRVSGGSPEFTWAWTPPTGVSNTTITNPIITPPATNVYTLTASYAHCPNMVHSFEITVDTPAIPVTINDTICLGMTQNVNLSFPGYAFYHFLWTPATYVANDTQAITTITPVAVGNLTYTISVIPGTGPTGCSVNDVVHLHVAPNDFILANPDTIICRGQSVLARVTGSTEFSYLWTPPTGVSVVNIQTPTLIPSVTTTYTVTASYAPHCPDMRHSFTITVDTPAIPVAIHDTICLGMTDNVNLTFPGSSFYNYVWTPTTYLSTSTSAISSITPLLTNTYTFTVTVSPGTNPAGCSVTDMVYLHVAPNDFTLSNDDTAICKGNYIQALVTGSTEFTYKWTPVAGVSDSIIMNPILTPTASTTYSVTASYAPHCPDMVHHFYIEVDTLAIPKTIFDTTCLGIPDSVNLSFPGSGSYTFVWAPATNVSNPAAPIVALVPTVTGTYNWTVNVAPKALNCSVNDVVNLLVVPNSFTIAPTDTTICAGNNVQMRGVPYPLFSYQWIPTSGIPISNIINPQITPDTTAMYVATATYSRCPPMHDTMYLRVQPNPSVYVGGNRFLCEYDTVHMTATVSPGWYGSYSYSWTPTTSLFESNTQTVVFKDTLTQKVVVIVKTPNGCVGSDSALVTVYPGNFLGLVGNKDLCPGDSARLTATGGSQYYWTPTMYLTDSIGVSTEIHPIGSGVYTVVGTNANGCKDTALFDVTVHPAATIYLPDTALIFTGESYAISAQGNCTGFMWTPTYGLDQNNISNPVATPDVSIVYHVTGSTEWGCITQDSIAVFVDNQTLLAVPNAFTPGNGPNAEFKIIKRGVATLNYFRIFNRWGNLVYESNSIDAGWNGDYKGAPQPFGVYVYMIEAVTDKGKIFTKQGNVTLIR